VCENFDEIWTYYPFIITKMKEISFLLILGMKFEELMNYYRFLYEKVKHRISSKACLKSINLKTKKWFFQRRRIHGWRRWGDFWRRGTQRGGCRRGPSESTRREWVGLNRDFIYFSLKIDLSYILELFYVLRFSEYHSDFIYLLRSL